MTFAYEVLPIVRSLSEIRKTDENGIKEDLEAIYCMGKRNEDLFFRLVWIEYGDELTQHDRSFSFKDVAHEIHQGQNITILRIKPCS